MKEGATSWRDQPVQSPAQVRLSKPLGSECCVRRRSRRTRSVYSGCVGCGNEPRNGELAGAEIVFMVERNMCDETAKLYAGTPTRGPQTLFHNTNEPSSFWRAALEAGHAEILAGGGER
jgi:hypothetical protein